MSDANATPPTIGTSEETNQMVGFCMPKMAKTLLDNFIGRDRELKYIIIYTSRRNKAANKTVKKGSIALIV